jgi:hypothetical protein
MTTFISGIALVLLTACATGLAPAIVTVPDSNACDYRWKLDLHRTKGPIRPLPPKCCRGGAGPISQRDAI